MTDIQTLDQFAEIIRKAKPYLIEIENEVQSVGYGDIEVIITVRAGVVQRMQFVKKATWLKDKA